MHMHASHIHVLEDWWTIITLCMCMPSFAFPCTATANYTHTHVIKSVCVVGIPYWSTDVHACLWVHSLEKELEQLHKELKFKSGRNGHTAVSGWWMGRGRGDEVGYGMRGGGQRM